MAGAVEPWLVPGIPHAEAAADKSHGDDDHHHARGNLAKPLVPHGDHAPGWLGPVVWTAILLFVAAVVIGAPVLWLKGPDPPDPAEDHGHDDAHGH